MTSGKFVLGDLVTKIKGSSWTGRVVGFYSATLTPIGYCVESINEPGSVQIYPENALRKVDIQKPQLGENTDVSGSFQIHPKWEKTI